MNAKSNVKKALVVDDSSFMRKLVSDFLNSHPAIEVVGIARNGRDAVEKVKALKPDVVTMDVEMPLMNGLEALKEIMEKHPVPVVMLSSTTKKGAENTMLAMEYGAVDFVAKPGGAISLNLHDVKEEIIEKVSAASGVPISKLTRLAPTRRIKQVPRPTSHPVQHIHKTNTVHSSKESPHTKRKGKKSFSKRGKTFVMIGTSTGGPRALQEVLTQLPEDLDVPILIVQHMPPSFTKSLADRLNGLCEITVKEAEDGELLVNGTAYIAPGGQHMKVRQLGKSYFINLDASEPPRNGHRPSVDVLFESAAECTTVNFLTVILTGMGYDGKVGTQLLKEKCETISIAESPETSVVYGMPKAIADAGLADDIVHLQEVPKMILRIIES